MPRGEIGRHKGLKTCRLRSASSSPSRAPLKIINMKEELDRALALHKKGQLTDAKDILRLLKLHLNNSSLPQLFGTLYLQKNYDLSEKYLLSSLNTTPDNPISLNNLGLLKNKP